MQELQPFSPETLPADIALKELVGSNIYLLGHGTTTHELANLATTAGLYTRHTDLSSTAYGLETLADNPEATKHDMGLIKKWPHRDAKYIVVLGVERLKGEDVPHRRYIQSIVQPRPQEDEYDATHGQPYVIDKKFIAGYFDVEQDTFIPNSAYDPTYDPRLLDTTVNDDIQREHNTVDPLTWLSAAYTEDAQHDAPPPPTAQPSEDDEDPHV